MMMMMMMMMTKMMMMMMMMMTTIILIIIIGVTFIQKKAFSEVSQCFALGITGCNDTQPCVMGRGC